MLELHMVQLSSVDLNLLVVLDAVLRTRSIRNAAEQIGRSPTATSHALARLRELLDDPILVRAGRTMVLTGRAEQISPSVHQLLEDLRSVLRFEGALDPAQLQRSFCIAATDYAEMIAVRALSDLLSREAPSVALYSMVLDINAVEQLRAGTRDIALGVFFELPDDISRAALFHEDFVCVMRQGHPALAGRLTLRRYAELGHVLVSPRGGPRGVVDEVLARYGLTRHIARTVASFLVAPHLIVHTDYVLTLPARVVRQLSPDVPLAMRKPPLPLGGFALEMLWHRRYETDPAHRWLREQATRATKDIG